MYDSIINESVQTILSKKRLDEFITKKDGLKDFDPNAIVNESSNQNLITDTKNIEVKTDTTTEEKSPVFSQLILKTKNQKGNQDLSEAINSVIVVQVGKSKCSGIIISDDGYILTSYALLDGDSTKTCEIVF